MLPAACMGSYLGLCGFWLQCRDEGVSGATDEGQYVAALMQRKLDCRGWRLVVTGHSLGAGAAALIALHLYGRFQSARSCACSGS